MILFQTSFVKFLSFKVLYHINDKFHTFCKTPFQEAVLQTKKLGYEPRNWATNQETGLKTKKLDCKPRNWATDEDTGLRTKKLCYRRRHWVTNQETGLQTKKLDYKPRNWTTKSLRHQVYFF